LAVFLLTPAREHAWVPFHEALKQAEVVVTAEAVGIKYDSSGKRTAEVRPLTVLKGECSEKLLQFPIREFDQRIGCPPPAVDYVKGHHYLLLLGGKPLRETNAQFSTLQSLDDPIVKLTPIVLDLLEKRNVEQRVKELGAFVDAPIHDRLAYEAIELLTREQARPILPAARKYFAAYTKQWPNPLPREGAVRQSYLGEIMSHSRWTMDFKQLARAREECASPPHFVRIASRVCGRPFGTMAEFDAWWERTLVRSEAKNPRAVERAEGILRQLRSGDPAARDGVAERLLDLGLLILPSIEALRNDSNENLRAVVPTVLEGLQLLRDFKDDLAR